MIIQIPIITDIRYKTDALQTETIHTNKKRLSQMG